jgi:dipeptidase
MCDTLVVVTGDGVLFAKNSDREPGEAQAVEHRARARHAPGTRLAVTHIEIEQSRETNEVAISRPAWMWGAEMGVNEHGLAIGNEAVFTRVPVEPVGLTGMDLVRLALERCETADGALDLVTTLLARHGQGGRAGFRNRSFTYHNAFLIADPKGAWLLETAGRFWAAQRIDHGARSTSNVLTIGAEYTRIGPGTIEGARSLGLLRPGETFDFRRCFGRPVVGWLSGGDLRRACTQRSVTTAGPRAVGLGDMARALRDHAGREPEEGARILMPCAHASWLPTRGAGQTTGTMIARLARGKASAFFTGTSAPCISVLKPVPLGRGPVDTGPAPSAEGYDASSLFWRAERLHRVVLRSYDARRAAFEEDRAALEARALLAADDGAAASDAWTEHREAIPAWTDRASRVPPKRARAFDAWWRMQSWRDGVPP